MGQDGVDVHWLDGDETVLCVIGRAHGRTAAVLNSRYPEAEAHARAHVAAGIDDVLICRPDCDGPHS